MMSSRLFRDRLILIGVVLVSWIALAFIGNWAFLLFVPALGALFGTIVWPFAANKFPKPIKTRKWFIISAAAVAAALTFAAMLPFLVPSAFDPVDKGPVTDQDLIWAAISFFLALAAIFWLFQLGREAYRSYVAKTSGNSENTGKKA
ncbi:hypothetical protein [Rhodoluna sp.]|jgi:hypothetical protein|uniref:hypothetical protein n=1 Tax=Rhodoluna sp. TaxID=1969481 RepID=UPI0025F64580|nr:hypothetical protein [Rhodoluna sp.]